MSKSKLNYIREEIPSFEIPPYRGERYEALVPDTLDLAEMAELAINGLTGPTDPESDYVIYFAANFFNNPPCMVHTIADICVVKFMEALPLPRIITGSDLNSHVDCVWMEVILKSIAPGGLFYTSTEAWPWLRSDLQVMLYPPVWRADGTTTGLDDESVIHFTSPLHCGRVIAAMTIYFHHDKNPIWKVTIERMIQRLPQLAIDKGDYCYYPYGFFEPNAKLSPDTEMPIGRYASDGPTRLIQGLIQYYRMTGYEPARKLPGKIVKYLKDYAEYYDSQGHFLPDQLKIPSLYHGLHFHAHTIGLLSILDYAMAVDDRDLMEFVKKGYEDAKTQGSSLVGFFPELITPYYPSSETCGVAEMIALAIKLSVAGGRRLLGRC